MFYGQEVNTELIEKFPYMAELFKRIDSINNAIDHGGDGLEQAYNLLTDLPPEWLAEIKDDLIRREQEHTRLNTSYQSLPLRSKRIPAVRNNNVWLSRLIKNTVIGVLNKKGVLLLTKKAIEMSSFSALEEENEKDE